MDYYMLGGMLAIALAAGLVGLRLARDEMVLRRKRILLQ